METIEPCIKPPWWESPIETVIPRSKEEAQKHYNDIIEAINSDSSAMCIYTDGSGIDKGIGAAAYSSSTSETKQEYLGVESTHNIFAAELVATDLATEILKQYCKRYQRCYLYCDSQAAIQALNHPNK